MRALLLLIKSDLLIANYDAAAEKLLQVSELSKKTGHSENNIQINFLTRILCDKLGIESDQLYLILNKNEMIQNDYEKALKSYTKSNWKQTIKFLKRSEKDEKFDAQQLTNFYYSLAYSNLGKNDSAEYYTDKIRNFEPYYFYAIAKNQFAKRNFDKSIQALDHLKPIESNIQNVWLKAEIYQLYAENDNYLKDWNSYQMHYQLQNSLQDSISNARENARISFLAKIDQKQDEILESKYDYSKRIIYLILIFIFTVLIFSYFLNRKLRQKETNIEKALMESEERQRFINENKLPESSGKIVIPDKTIQFLLEKLELFERNEEYINPSTSLNQLAENLNTNTKYLSEIINTHKNKNFHSYINELRINYVINKLNNNPIYLKYKVSHLAEEAGFSSHSLFSTVFKQVTGLSPASFIKSNIKKESDGDN
ncbi:helix-turn-helix domain-containing protein [Chryseobacterium sp. FH1]|uniref:helix-turn-helix domain-containing protein n=1 Tax=Chryseobacterium sp. FH1 TaxID=1233951 RepID=UPI000A7CF151|nr:helix-turn-helix domain-containing protein [Chryseobacterium sp. FH1]